MKKAKAKIGVVLLVAGLVLVVLGFSFEFVLASLSGGRHTPTDDSCARLTFPSDTHGSIFVMLIQKHPDDTAIGYMKFDLSSIGGSVKSATLHLCYYSYEPGFNMELWSAGDGWNEATLCWNNKPQDLQKLGSTYVSKREQVTWVEFDVTSFINSEIAGDKVASFALGVPDYSEDEYTYVRTKEFSDYYAPYLTYETTTPPPTDFTLSTSVQPYGGGSVVPSGGTYAEGTSVTIVATPSSGYRFDHWAGDASGTSTITTVVMNSNKSVTAYFTAEQVYYTLSTHVEPSGSGYIVLNPSAASYASGTSVSLSATANAGWEFDCWAGNASGTSPSTTVTMNSDKTVTAHFKIEGSDPDPHDPLVAQPNWYLIASGALLSVVGALVIAKYEGWLR